MTQKELLYVEDAIGHENSIIEIFENMKNNFNNEKLELFMEEEINKHQELKTRLLNLLKEQANG